MNGAPPPVVPYVTIRRAVERIVLRTTAPDAVGTVPTEDAAEAATTTAGHKQQQQQQQSWPPHQQQLEQDVSSPPRLPPTPTTASSRKWPRCGEGEALEWGSEEGELDDDRIEGGHRWETSEDRAKTKNNLSISRKLADGHCHRHASVVAIVVGVSAPIESPRRRTHPRHHKRYLWIVDPSVRARDKNYGGRDGGDNEDDQHQERAAVVSYYGGSSSSSSISAVDTMREGDVVALHGLVLTKECQRRLLNVRGDERRGVAAQQTYEFVHDTRASVFADHPQIPAVLLLAHVPKGTTKRISYYHDRNSNAPHRRPEFTSSVSSSELDRAASEVIEWYVRWNAPAPTTTSATPPTRRGAAGVRDGGDDENDDDDCGGRDRGYHRCVVVQRSVSDLLLGGGRCGSGRRGTTGRVVSHLVARVTAVHECATSPTGDEGSRGATNRAARSRRRRCRESLGPRELCPATNNCTVVLLSDATSELPIPLVMQRNQHGKLRQRLADLMSSFETARDDDDDDDAPSRSLWLRFTHLETVRRHDALWGAADCAPDHDNANAMALVPTSDTTVSVASRDEPIDPACRTQPSQAAELVVSQQPTTNATHPCPADRTLMTTNTVTIEAPIASIRVDFLGGRTIVMNATNVRDAVSRVLPLLRRHDERWTKWERDGRRRPHTDGDGDEVEVSIALERDDDDNEDHPRTHHPADWPAIRSLLWSDRDAVQSGPLDDIAGRMVAGMLQESVRFSWIVERRRGGATQDATAPFRIVDVSLRQL